MKHLINLFWEFVEALYAKRKEAWEPPKWMPPQPDNWEPEPLEPIKPAPPLVVIPPKPIMSTPVKEVLKWATPKQAWHSVRVLCDEMGLTWVQKNIVCATIFAESEFNNNAVGPNARSVDHGICQINDGPPGVPPSKKWYIGPGKLFSSINDVYNNPERAVRYMIRYYKQHGHMNPWYAYKHGKYKKFLPLTSRMWKLAEK